MLDRLSVRRDRDRETERDRQRKIGRERESVCVCVFVCERDAERNTERERERERERYSKCVRKLDTRPSISHIQIGKRQDIKITNQKKEPLSPNRVNFIGETFAILLVNKGASGITCNTLLIDFQDLRIIKIH